MVLKSCFSDVLNDTQPKKISTLTYIFPCFQSISLCVSLLASLGFVEDSSILKTRQNRQKRFDNLKKTISLFEKFIFNQYFNRLSNFRTIISTRHSKHSNHNFT